MLDHLYAPTPIQRLALDSFARHGVDAYIKRDDLIHPEIIGNKVRKSLAHFFVAKREGIRTVVTFGGRFSNHILAVSQLARISKLRAIGIIRGTDLRNTSPVLERCRANGMKIVPVEHRNYYPLQLLSSDDLGAFLNENESLYVIPEGGTSVCCLEGVAEIINEIRLFEQFNFIACPVGSGGTAAGLLYGLHKNLQYTATKVVAMSVLRGYRALPAPGMNALIQLLGQSEAEALVERRLIFEGTSPFGRYGKPAASVIEEIRGLQESTGTPLDYVYSGRVLLQLTQMSMAGYFPDKTRLLMLHTGGYQTAPV